MNIVEQAHIHIEQCSFDNNILHNIILEQSNNEDIGAMMTKWDCFDVPEFKTIGDYAMNVVKEWDNGDDVENFGKLELECLWGQWYREGDYQEPHEHYPNHYSFVYYVNTPDGSAPLVFPTSDYKHYPKSGQLIIFPAWVIHFVPPNKCKGRSIVAGNMYYKRTIGNVSTLPYI
tara:strand:+ start:3654 stop:4175 length:522 start_codon:yes stop_codon:yes gene_type:complete